MPVMSDGNGGGGGGVGGVVGGGIVISELPSKAVREMDGRCVSQRAHRDIFSP